MRGWLQTALGRPVLRLGPWLLHPTSWLLLGGSLGLAILWCLTEWRGQPQWRYRLFPLTSRGAVGSVACWLFALAALLFAWRGRPKSDPELEKTFDDIANGQRDAASLALQAERWSGAWFESDVAALRGYVLPVFAALFDDAEAALGMVAQQPPYIACVISSNRAGVLGKLCGGRQDDYCAATNQKMRDAINCYQRRGDVNGSHAATFNLAGRLLNTSEFAESYRLFLSELVSDDNGDAGLLALSLERFHAVVPSGTGLDSNRVRSVMLKNPSPSSDSSLRCVDLIERSKRSADTAWADNCSIAQACFLTDDPAAKVAFCGVPDIPQQGAVKLPSGSLPTGPATYVVRGTVRPTQGARDIVADCDGDVEKSATATLHFQQRQVLTARVYSAEDSLLLIRSAQGGQCANDSPLNGARSLDAGLRLIAEPGDYAVYVGTWTAPSLDFALRIQLSDPPP